MSKYSTENSQLNCLCFISMLLFVILIFHLCNGDFTMKKVLFCLVMTIFAVFSLHAQSTGQDAEIIKLLRQVNKKLTDVDQRLQKLEKKKRNAIPVPITQAFVPKGPNVKALSKIKFPAKPNKANLKEYVKKVLNASPNQNNYTPNDMQVGMLEKVGQKNLDVLVDSLTREQPGHNRNFFLGEAIVKLAKPEDKKLIVKGFAKCKKLIDVIVRYHWERDVKKILLDGMSNSDYLPDAWLCAVTGFRDPETYPVLIEYLISHSGRLRTYDMICDLPGIKLKNAVREAWYTVQMQQNAVFEKFCFSIIAVEYGYKEALEYLLENRGNRKYSYYSSRCNQAIRDHVDFDGTTYEIDQWYKKNKKNIVFDYKDKKFKLKSAASKNQGGK